jgi:hypothetical protein
MSAAQTGRKPGCHTRSSYYYGELSAPLSVLIPVRFLFETMQQDGPSVIKGKAFSSHSLCLSLLGRSALRLSATRE